MVRVGGEGVGGVGGRVWRCVLEWLLACSCVGEATLALYCPLTSSCAGLQGSCNSTCMSDLCGRQWYGRHGNTSHDYQDIIRVINLQDSCMYMCTNCVCMHVGECLLEGFPQVLRYLADIIKVLPPPLLSSLPLGSLAPPHVAHVHVCM